MPANFENSGVPVARPVEVPSFVSLHSEERVVQNHTPPAHAVTVLRAPTKLGGWRDHIITFVYGREQPLLAPQHLTVDSRGRLIVSDPQFPAVHVIDGKNSFRISGGERRRLLRPAGVAVDGDDNIYVVDSERGLVDVYDPDGNFLRFIGKLDDETLFDYPTGIAIDRSHARLYLVDTPRSALLILDLQGHILKRVGRRNTEDIPVEFSYPTEVTMNGDEVVVLDSAGSRLQVFDLDGKLVRRIKTYASGPSTGPRTVAPTGLGADQQGNIYLTSAQGASIRIFTREGRVLNSFGKMGSKAHEFNRPSGVWIQRDRLYVSDTANRQIDVFKVQSIPTDRDTTELAAGR